MKPAVHPVALRASVLALVSAAALTGTGCNRNVSPGTAPSASGATPSSSSAGAPSSSSATPSAGSAGASSAASVSTAAPENLLLTMRGMMLRRALPLLFPEGGAAEVVEQLSRQLTPGIGDHAREIDIDSPFVVAGTVGGSEESTLSLFVAWPLKPGMQIAQDARALRGFRRVSDGVFAPTAAPSAAPPSGDAGFNPADHTCWVAQRQPVGWMLLCGPRENIEQVAGYLFAQANHPPDNAPVLEVDLRAGVAGRLARRQLAELDAHAPPQGSASDPASQARRAMFDEARRSAALFTAIANDVDAIHGSLTQDENAMHLRAELTMPRASSDTTRALVASAVGHTIDRTLLELLPAATESFVIGGFDRAQMMNAMGAPRLDPAVSAQAGPELARVMGTVDELKSLTPLGERIDAYSAEDGYTMYHVIRRPDAGGFVNELRAALAAIPPRALPEGGTLRDVATSLPTTGLDPATTLRIGRNIRVPPGARIPPEMRAVLERSMLLVAQENRLVAVMGRDPIARYRAMSQGARLSTVVPANAVLAGRVTPNGFAPLFYGSSIPGLPQSQNTDGIDFSVSAERRGEGVRLQLTADAPIPAAIEVRNYYAMIQELQARMMAQMVEQARRAQQGGGGPGPMMGGGGGGGGGPRRPALDPSQIQLPEPPALQLRPPQ